MSNIWKSTTQLSILLTKPVKSDLIFKKIEQILGYCAESARKKIVGWGRTQIFYMGGQVLLGVTRIPDKSLLVRQMTCKIRTMIQAHSLVAAEDICPQKSDSIQYIKPQKLVTINRIITPCSPRSVPAIQIFLNPFSCSPLIISISSWMTGIKKNIR